MLVAKNQTAEITQLTTATRERVSRAVVFLSEVFIGIESVRVRFGIVVRLSQLQNSATPFCEILQNLSK